MKNGVPEVRLTEKGATDGGFVFCIFYTCRLPPCQGDFDSFSGFFPSVYTGEISLCHSRKERTGGGLGRKNALDEANILYRSLAAIGEPAAAVISGEADHI